MKYVVTIGGRTREFVVDGDQVEVDGRRHTARVEMVDGTPVCHLVLDGRSWSFAVTPGEPGEWLILDRGEPVAVEVLDERTRYIRSLIGAGRSHSAGGPVKAPMPGLVVKILVEVGQAVAAGQGLLVLEAMKMENEIKAVGAGTVDQVHVRAGAAVEKGAVLVTLRAE